MELFDLFFGVGPATQALFKIGFHPKDEDFLELTPEQYEKFCQENGDVKEPVYALLPKDPQQCASVAAEDVMVFTDSERKMLERGWKVVEKYCEKSQRSFSSDEEKMIYAASLLPDVFCKGTRFEIYNKANMSVIKGQKE